MKVRRMIEELQKYNPDAEVRMHHIQGNNALFVLGINNIENVVVLEDQDDNDIHEELKERFEQANNVWDNELDFFLDLIEIGYTLDNIKENYPEGYEYAKAFMEDHGLL